MRHLRHIGQLGIKELLSLARDSVLLFLIAYSFTFSVYTPAKSAVMDVINASVAVVDEDHSTVSRQIRDSLLPPLFLPAAVIPFGEINRAMDEGKYTFVIDIPPKFQHDLTKGTAPTVEVITDATAMSQAGRGPSYIQKIITAEAEPFWAGKGKRENQDLVRLVTRARFNPNMQQSWFVAINQIINNISVLAIFLTGAAVLREREHGTIEHLLVMPLRPYELMFAKILGKWARRCRRRNAFAFSDRARSDRSSYRRIDYALSRRSYSISLLCDGARRHARHPGSLHAAIRTVSVSGFHRHEPPVGRPNASREHADSAAKVYAVCALDALRQFFSGGTVQKRDSGDGVAGHDQDALDWRRVHRLHAFEVPQDACGNSIGVVGEYALFN